MVTWVVTVLFKYREVEGEMSQLWYPKCQHQHKRHASVLRTVNDGLQRLAGRVEAVAEALSPFAKEPHLLGGRMVRECSNMRIGMDIAENRRHLFVRYEPSEGALQSFGVPSEF